SALAAGASAHAPVNVSNAKPFGKDGDGEQVVRLSAESVSVPVTEMTQQQKIAAALVRAGITNPMAWAAGGVATQDLAEVRAAVSIPAPKTATFDAGPEQPAANEI